MILYGGQHILLQKEGKLATYTEMKPHIDNPHSCTLFEQHQAMAAACSQR